MGCMQWHVVINSPLDIVTLALQSPAVMISRAIFARIRQTWDRKKTLIDFFLFALRNIPTNVDVK